MVDAFRLSFEPIAKTWDSSPVLIVIGSKQQLTASRLIERLPESVRSLWPRMLADVKPGDCSKTVSTWIDDAKVNRVIAGVLPDSCSRHNSPAQPHAIRGLVSDNAKAKGDVTLIMATADSSLAMAQTAAIARGLPSFQRKQTASDSVPSHIHVSFLTDDGSTPDLHKLDTLAYAVRSASEWVDTPTSELHTLELIDHAKKIAKETGAEITVIQGKDLHDKGFGGLWGVGKAANKPPALVVLQHKAKNSTSHVTWVGKGIVYDTGGLSIKDSTHMPGMKADMGGAAAVLAAFRAAVKMGCNVNLSAVLCLAENAIGPDAQRPDDIITLYSGKTVEVNNTDAEGRLVLGDGLAYAVKHLKPDVLIDIATLTGAQLVSTGKRHAAIISNDEAIEQAAVHAGRRSGDLVHPLIYCPEFFRDEFKSDIADMKNSVKDRMNAQTSCAGQFLADHLGDKFTGQWLHIDIAGPAGIGERASGFGVALLLDLLEHNHKS